MRDNSFAFWKIRPDRGTTSLVGTLVVLSDNKTFRTDWKMLAELVHQEVAMSNALITTGTGTHVELPL